MKIKGKRFLLNNRWQSLKCLFCFKKIHFKLSTQITFLTLWGMAYSDLREEETDTQRN